jgi:hypothetical protein
MLWAEYIDCILCCYSFLLFLHPLSWGWMGWIAWAGCRGWNAFPGRSADRWKHYLMNGVDIQAHRQWQMQQMTQETFFMLLTNKKRWWKHTGINCVQQ